MIKHTCLLLLTSVLLYGCVSQKKFLAQDTAFRHTQDSLYTIIQSLDDEKDTFRMALSYERGINAALLTTQDRLQDRLDILQLNIDQLKTNASSTAQKLFVDMQQKEREMGHLAMKIDAIQEVINKNKQRLSDFAQKVSPYSNPIKTDSIELRQRNIQLIIAIGENVLFRKSSTSSLTKEGQRLLAGIAEIIQQYPEMNIQVIGHTDNRDVNRQGLDNWQYSALRAVSIVKYFSANTDVGANRVMAATKSEFAPLQSNETAEGRARNRRIELVITPPIGFLEQKIQKILQE